MALETHFIGVKAYFFLLTDKTQHYVNFLFYPSK